MKRLLLQVALLVAATLPSLSLFAQTPPPPVMRLDDAVRPLAYDLALTLLPDQPEFEGRVVIDVELARPLDFFWLNGNGLEVRGATWTMDGRTQPVQAVVDAGSQAIGIRLPEAAPAGRGRLAIAYSGRYSTNETRGLFKQRDNERWYAFTQFESINARRAIPCFDEPHWKTPWTVTLTVPADQVAVANTRALAEQPVPGGLKQVRFAPTPPLPSYLVAFAAGPFEVVEGGLAGKGGTPLRYIVPAGRSGELRFVRQSTPRVLQLLEDYFGSAYPYDKLDSVVIPITVNFWAMENPGLITYRSSLMLAKPELEDERFQQLYVAIAAHEIAHQWFGNLVTMDWWEDLWLKESFATWMAGKTAQRFNPEWEIQSRRERQRQNAFVTDRLLTTRQVRQPVNTRDDLGNAYDRITYDKGGAVLTMFEAWLGEAAFRDGVRRYMAKHAHGNASATDFFAAMGAADPQVARAFQNFVARPGLPLVDFTLECGGAAPAVRLRQQRFLPALPASNEQPWLVPVCLRHAGQAEGSPPQCTLLREPEQLVPLQAGRCPAWVLPNPGGTGYYLSRIGRQEREGLALARLQPQEAIALLAEQALLANSAALPVRDLLALAVPLAADSRPEVVAAVAQALDELHLGAFDAATSAELGAWVLRHLGPRAVAVGWLPRREDNDAVRKLRGVLLPVVAGLGGHPALQAQARQLALNWLGGDRAALGAMGRQVLRTAAAGADAAFFDAMLQAARQARDVATRLEVYGAMGKVEDPALLQRAFELALAPGADLRETKEIYETAGWEPANAGALLRFVGARYEGLVARLPEESIARMPRWHAGLCAVDDRQQLAALYGPKMHALSGGGRNLAQTLEHVDICVLNRKQQARAAAAASGG